MERSRVQSSIRHRSAGSPGGRQSAATVLVAALALAACATAGTPAPEPPRPSPTSTSAIAIATLVPTATPTPAVTPTPTLPIDVEGTALLEERFDSPGEWETGASADGAATILDSRLVIAVGRRNTSRLVVSPAEPEGDVFVEAVVEAQLCSPGDEYGLAFRIGPDGSYDRFTIGCDGSARFTRVLPDRSVALAVLEPQAAIIPGTEGANRLAVLAAGPTIRCFVNAQEVITLREPLLTFGRQGLIVRAGRSGQTTVAFDSFRVLHLAPTPTPVPAP
jgi:hypothetical protein